jgi:hypothetical protein
LLILEDPFESNKITVSFILVFSKIFLSALI